MQVNELTIVVCCNRKDFFLARICIASIRYYYPEIPVELIKDPGNGKFSSREVEKYFNVNVVDLKISKMGWSGAKFHYLYQQQKGKKILILDADIVFTGPFQERLLPAISGNDYVVSIEENDISNKEWVKNTYFDIEEIQETYPAYKYPGYFFNAGQIFLTVGSVEEKFLNEFFDPYNYPYWRNTKLFPLVDQSVYNYLLPTLASENKLKLGKEKFMLWAMQEECLNLSLEKIKEKSLQAGVIHWAGCPRQGYLSKMVRGDILRFFENYYYSRMRLGRVRKLLRKIKPVPLFYLKQLYHKIKPSNWLQG